MTAKSAGRIVGICLIDLLPCTHGKGAFNDNRLIDGFSAENDDLCLRLKRFELYNAIVVGKQNKITGAAKVFIIDPHRPTDHKA